MSDTLHVIHCRNCGARSAPMRRKDIDKRIDAHIFGDNPADCHHDHVDVHHL